MRLHVADSADVFLDLGNNFRFSLSFLTKDKQSVTLRRSLLQPAASLTPRACFIPVGSITNVPNQQSVDPVSMIYRTTAGSGMTRQVFTLYSIAERTDPPDYRASLAFSLAGEHRSSIGWSQRFRPVEMRDPSPASSSHDAAVRTVAMRPAASSRMRVTSANS